MKGFEMICPECGEPIYTDTYECSKCKKKISLNDITIQLDKYSYSWFKHVTESIKDKDVNL